jgi:putative holliday junction resolvase
MTTIVGIDLGERRIGVAIGDTLSGTVRPLLTLRRGTARQDADAIARICHERRAHRVVVGLPLHLDGMESDQSARTRAWVEAMQSMLDVPLTFQDERLTSHEAELRMGRAPRGRSGAAPSAAARNAWRSRIDREAAAAIVQRELDARAGSTVEVTR